MRRVALLSVGAFFALAASSQSPVACIDPDVVNGLLMVGQGEHVPVFGTAVPAELADFKAPRELTWLGSSERRHDVTINGAVVPMPTVAAVYRSTLPPDAARELALQTLTSGGWRLVAANRMVNVFASGASSLAETLCREATSIGLRSNALDGITYVVLTVQRDSGVSGIQNTCARQRPVSAAPAALQGQLPRLDAPRDPAGGAPLPTTGGGTTSGEQRHSSSIGFTLRDTAPNVARHFARQLAAQGWESDANWSSERSAGSTWSRRADAGSVTHGTLIVSRFGGDRFSVVFRGAQTNPGGSR